MIQCDKVLALGTAERRDVLEKSGLCMFCLKHSAEFECYGKGGLSKPRCTRGGCDGEHTPNVHMLMSEDDAKVSLVAGSEDEEGLETGDETADVLTQAISEDLPEEGEAGESNERGSDFQEGREPEEGTEGDGWWDLRAGSPDLEVVGVSTLQIGPSHCLPLGSLRPGHPTAPGEQWTGRRQEAASDQEWEEARQYARLRQVSYDGFSSEDEDEDEGQLGGWRLESFEPP
jgi:hypothetical protein